MKFFLLFILFFSLGLSAQHKASLRLMAANITSGRFQSYDDGHGVRIFKGLKADVILIQEFNIGSNSKQEIDQWVKNTFGSEYHYFREKDAQIANGIISRFPIIKSGEWTDPYVGNRDFAWSCIDIPGKPHLWVISVHLLGSDARKRTLEAEAILGYIKAHIPEEDFLVLGGDFNTRKQSEMALQKLQTIFKIRSSPPVDQLGNPNTNANRNKPYDWILVDADLAPYQVPTVIGENQFPFGLVFDSRNYQPVTDVFPVQKKDSGSFNMQHMAVLKDFQIPFEKEDILTPDSVLVKRIEISNLASTKLPITGVVEKNGWNYFLVSPSIEAQFLKVELKKEGDGDADLYIKKGQIPTKNLYDHRPYLSITDEQVTFALPPRQEKLALENWYIGVYGYRATKYQLSIKIESEIKKKEESRVLDLQGSITKGKWKNYRVEVPQGKELLQVELDILKGDSDLYIKRGSLPTLSSFDFRPHSTNENEIVKISESSYPALKPGTWHISIYGHQTSSFKLKATLK